MAIVQLQQVGMMIIPILLLWHILCSSCSALPPELIAKKNCQSDCGGVSIPYPFGIGTNKSCYMDEWFEIDCKVLNSTSRPFLKHAQLEVLSISMDEDKQSVRVLHPVTFFDCEGKQTLQYPNPNLTGSPFLYSKKNNTFTAVSCGHLTTVRFGNSDVLGCGSTCGGQTTSEDYKACNIGMDCCQTSIPSDLPTPFSIEIPSQSRDNNISNDCKYAFLVEKEWLQNLSNFRQVKEMDNVPVVLEWSLIFDSTSSLLKSYEPFSGGFIYQNSTRPCCGLRDNTTYKFTLYNQSKFTCVCRWGFEGNPYLPQGCQDIDECVDSINPCGRFRSPEAAPICENYVGGYRCYSDVTGYTCDAYGRGGSLCRYINSQTRTSPIKTILSGLGAGLGLLLLLIGGWLGYRLVKKRNNIKRKQLFFKRNGGLLLEQQLSSGEVNVEKIKLFNSKELQKSTDNFNMDRILGQGGQGTVYKGMLADGRIIAVKKSKIVDESQLSDFINEVVILSQINHRNVVQLLGCCLETEVPILVYEFVPNGTLSQYIHEQNEEFPLTWEIRLRIATEIAGSLSYLHASASSPIYHRDIKSTNILLDAKYRAKVADFGTSRSVSIDQTHLTTLVHGTFGYLDPEYFQSSQFTDKSDVYSFGVVLVELLTGLKPISSNRSTEEGKSLATYFINSMQSDRLFEILDAQVVNGGSKEDIITVANLARRCLNLSGRKRPTMREVTAELEGVQMTEKTSDVEQHLEEADEYVRSESIEAWDVVSSSTGAPSVLDSGNSASSLPEIPLLSIKSW